MNNAFVFARPVKLSLVVFMLALSCAPALVAAQAEVPPAQGLNNPLNRNPLNRRGLSDSAPVEQDPRNSTTRPTLPAAPVKPDARDAAPPAQDRSRGVPPPAQAPVTPSGTTLFKPRVS